MEQERLERKKEERKKEDRKDCFIWQFNKNSQKLWRNHKTRMLSIDRLIDQLIYWFSSDWFFLLFREKKNQKHVWWQRKYSLEESTKGRKKELKERKKENIKRKEGRKEGKKEGKKKERKKGKEKKEWKKKESMKPGKISSFECILWHINHCGLFCAKNYMVGYLWHSNPWVILCQKLHGWLVGVLWHINHCGLFNAKSYFYI